MLGPKKAVRGDSTVIHFISVFSFKLLSLHHLSVIYNFLAWLDVVVKKPFVICNLSDNKSSKLVARNLSNSIISRTVVFQFPNPTIQSDASKQQSGCHR